MKLLEGITKTILLILAGLFSNSLPVMAENQALPVYGRLGGSLQLEATDPGLVASANVKLISFGFARCTDVCPLVLAKYTQVLSSLGEMEQEFVAMFVSVDSDRDTVESLRNYTQKFHSAIVGLMGDDKQTVVALSQFAAFAEKNPTNGEFDHTDRIYLLDELNQVRAMFKPSDSTQLIVSSIHRLL